MLFYILLSLSNVHPFFYVDMSLWPISFSLSQKDFLAVYSSDFILFILKYLFIYLAVLGLSSGARVLL